MKFITISGFLLKYWRVLFFSKRRETVCVGSSCHIKGARRVVEGLTKLVKESGMSELVRLSGSFCMGRCEEDGVSVKVDGEIHFVDPDHVEEFFRDVIMGSWK